MWVNGPFAYELWRHHSYLLLPVLVRSPRPLYGFFLLFLESFLPFISNALKYHKDVFYCESVYHYIVCSNLETHVLQTILSYIFSCYVSLISLFAWPSIFLFLHTLNLFTAFFCYFFPTFWPFVIWSGKFLQSYLLILILNFKIYFGFLKFQEFFLIHFKTK